MSIAIRSPRFRSRAGFTLVESIVAILLVNIGLLALMSGTVMVARTATATRLRAASAVAAQNRLDSLRVVACGWTQPRSGTDSTQRATGIIESWSVTPDAGSTVELRDSATYIVWGRPATFVVRSAALC